VVEEFNRQDFNVSHGFENRHTNMMASGNVQENSIYEEQECFNVQMLAPREA